MAKWTTTNRACKTLWTSLSTMDQLSSNFDESGEIKMCELTFFNPLVSSELRKQQAAMVADQLDNIFRNGRGATFERNTDRGKAVTRMREILADESKLLCDLAHVIDESYQFISEPE